MDKSKVLSKIKKLMAIAADSTASDQEIQLAAYRAKKLMIKHKIEEYEIFGCELKEDAERVMLTEEASGYCIWTLDNLAEKFRCRAFFNGKINTNCKFGLYGQKSDLQLVLPIANGIIYYLNHMLNDLKECYIGETDFRIFKREYLNGFASGLKAALLRAETEMLEEHNGHEIALVFQVPENVEDMYKKKVTQKRSSFAGSDPAAHQLGKKHGEAYDVERKDLLSCQ